MSELQSGNDVISVPTSAEKSAISAQEEDHFIVLEEIPVQQEVLGNICIEQAPASKSADLHTALPSTSTSKTADVLTKSRAPKRKRKTDSVLEAKISFYKRRLERLEAEHKIKMENFKLDNEIKHLEILEKRRKLGLDNQ